MRVQYLSFVEFALARGAFIMLRNLFITIELGADVDSIVALLLDYRLMVHYASFNNSN